MASPLESRKSLRLIPTEQDEKVMKTKWAVWGSGGIALRRTIPEGIVKATNAQLVAVYDVTTPNPIQ